MEHALRATEPLSLGEVYDRGLRQRPHHHLRGVEPHREPLPPRPKVQPRRETAYQALHAAQRGVTRPRVGRLRRPGARTLRTGARRRGRGNGRCRRTSTASGGVPTSGTAIRSPCATARYSTCARAATPSTPPRSAVPPSSPTATERPLRVRGHLRKGVSAARPDARQRRDAPPHTR